LLQLLRKSRKEQRITQDQVASALGMPRSIIGKIERGERRIDVIELRDYCGALGIPLILFVHQLESALDKKRRSWLDPLG